MAEQLTIRFTRKHQVQAIDGPTYDAGQIVTLPRASAEHFISRCSAVLHSPEITETSGSGSSTSEPATPDSASTDQPEDKKPKSKGKAKA